MILRIGVGSLRTRVGIATIWSSGENSAFSSRSITSIRYFAAKVQGALGRSASGWRG